MFSYWNWSRYLSELCGRVGKMCLQEEPGKVSLRQALIEDDVESVQLAIERGEMRTFLNKEMLEKLYFEVRNIYVSEIWTKLKKN